MDTVSSHTHADREPAVIVEHLTVNRGDTQALDKISVTIPTGTITGLLGPSGCGKTTLMRSIVGTQRITSGHVTVLGRQPGERSLRGEIGYVTQSPSVYTDLTVRENLSYFASLYPASREERNSAIEQAIAVVGLTAQADRRAESLSGGQLNRVSVAVALVGRPRLLILDEPTVGLDPVLRAELWATFHKLADDGATLVVSSHVMDEADHCQTLILLRNGRLVGQMSPAGLREHTGENNLESAFLALITETSPQ